MDLRKTIEWIILMLDNNCVVYYEYQLGTMRDDHKTLNKNSQLLPTIEKE